MTNIIAPRILILFLHMRSLITGQLFIVAAPSGGGKTSLVKQLVNTLDHIEVSVSHTTRDKRTGETEGQHYFFVSEPKFLEMVNASEFVEHAAVYGHYYGTSEAQIQTRLARGIDVVLDIDWQGAKQIRHRFKDAVSVFILPPSIETLEQRLVDRQREHADIIQERMEHAHAEVQHYAEFDYLIVNEDFQQAALELQAIVTATRLRMSVQAKRHAALLSLLSTTR